MNDLISQKRLAVVAGDKIMDVVVNPGTTAYDVLRSLNLPGDYILSGRDGLPFGESETIYHLQEGEKLYASPPAIVG